MRGVLSAVVWSAASLPALANAFSLRGSFAGALGHLPAPIKALMKDLLPFYEFADCARDCVRVFVANDMIEESELYSCQVHCAGRGVTPQEVEQHMLSTIAEYKYKLTPSDYEYLVTVVGERLSDLSEESAFEWVPCANSTNSTNSTAGNGTWPCVPGGN
jgi:hypothetical protein